MLKQNWTYKKVKEVCKKASSNIVLNKIEDNTGDFPLYGASGFVKGVDFYHRDEPYIGIVKDGSGVGRVDVYPAKSSLVGTMQYILPQKECSLKYLCYALQGLNLSQFVNGAAIPHIYFRDYGECTIPVPPIETQSRIVSELDLLQSIIDKQKAQLKELDNLAQAVFYDMFGEDKAIEQKWEKCRVGDIYKFQYGKGNNIPEDRGEYPCYGSNGVVGHHIIYNSEDAPIIGHIGAYAGIVNWGAGKHYVTYNGVICKLKDNRNNPIYGYYMLKSQDYLNAAKRGGAQPFVSYDLLEQPTIFIPPCELQQSFAAKMESIEKQKAAISQSMAETQKLFDYTMDKYFG